ncbi:MAG: secondary thiamine-phosphate synthase enzyme YjbQ [Gammaproteobacteria bacterium]|nr:secondary thiamine-phosphate synthase enzyme YjbQ [Gammaproteobacteria bacterium]MDH3507569.1 secondary thiamine-phosphate synthase enzyme YjbQ [Gammaproteobacteria bacterium]
MFQKEVEIATNGRGIYEISGQVAAIVAEAELDAGLCHVFCRHTSASLIICENADPSVLRDVETFFADLVRDGDPRFEHDAEGPDDMPAHIRSILTASDLTVPLTAGRLALGTWQGIFLYEHRTAPHRRRVLVTITN